MNSMAGEVTMKVRFKTFFLMVFLFTCIPNGFAQNREGTFTLTVPFLGWYQVDHGMSYDSDYTWGLGAGLNFNENIGIELTFNRLDSESADIFLYKIDLLFHLTELAVPGNVVPFVAAGIGDSKYNTSTDKKDDLFINLGPGIKYFLTDYMALRGDLRYILEFRGGDTYNNFLLSTGLMFQFGGEAPAPKPEPAIAEPATPPPSVPAPAEESKCPPAPEGCTDKDWCLKDSDGDGVHDCLDKCPETPSGSKVDANGCPAAAEKASFVFRNILFDFREASLKPASLPVLDEVAEYLKANPGLKMEIQGHTDSIGTSGFNKDLSKKRAEAVKAYLVKEGDIGEERLSAIGFGFNRPIATNKTEAGRAKNRRVEFIPFHE